jgi:hypothetical protein
VKQFEIEPARQNRWRSQNSTIAMAPKTPLGEPMTLGNMRQLGARGLAVYCINPLCRHQSVFSADDYPDEVPVPSFRARMKCGKCDGEKVDVRPNWKEQPVQMSLIGKRWR